MKISSFLHNLKVALEDPTVENVVILPHMFPDGDTIGSALAALHLVESFHKKGYIVLNDDIPSTLSFLMSDKFPVYNGNSFTLDTIDVCIAVDCGETKLFEDRKGLFERAAKTICIDHHRTNSYYADINLVDEGASSTGEMMFHVLKKLEVPIDPLTAQAIYAAICTDTGGFRYSNTTSVTFQAAAELMATGFDFNALNVHIFQNKPFDKVRLLNRVFETLVRYHGGKTAVVKLTQALIDELSLNEYDTDGIVEFVRDISGIEVVVFIREYEKDTFKISMRSKNNVDVSQVALAFNGGGHVKAAGFKAKGNLMEIETRLLKAIEEAI